MAFMAFMALMAFIVFGFLSNPELIPTPRLFILKLNKFIFPNVLEKFLPVVLKYKNIVNFRILGQIPCHALASGAGANFSSTNTL